MKIRYAHLTSESAREPQRGILKHDCGLQARKAPFLPASVGGVEHANNGFLQVYSREGKIM
jgi:hypothetical protein